MDLYSYTLTTYLGGVSNTINYTINCNLHNFSGQVFCPFQAYIESFDVDVHHTHHTLLCYIPCGVHHNKISFTHLQHSDVLSPTPLHFHLPPPSLPHTHTDTATLNMVAITHRLSHCDDSKQCHNIGMIELAHDGCLLQELHFVLLLCSRFERLQSHFQ